MATPDVLPPSTPTSHGILLSEKGRIDLTTEGPSPRRLRWLPILFVAIFAFLLASFPARNSDLWMHLAKGRQLAQMLSSGTLPWHSPEFSSNPNWLYDLLFYSLYSAIGGPGVVLLKALLVVGLALAVLRLCRFGSGWWIATVCTGLALLVMSPGLLLQPATVSYCFLALTLWFLWQAEFDEVTRRLGDDEEGSRSSATLSSGLRTLLPPWPLLVLFVFWANLDSWFVLGLGIVALVWIGQVLDRMQIADLLRRAVSFALLGAVCLLNPSHVYAFTLPQELGPVTSPFQPAYLANFGLRPAGLAYYPLLALGLLSFVLNLSLWRWQRFLPWLGLALLSGFQARTIPFYAVLAGPVLAWNLQEFFARHSETERRQGLLWERALLPLRVLSVVLGLAFLACAWPGWLQAPPFEPRRWAVEPSPSLVQGAAAIGRWHQEGKLEPGARGLHVSPQTASAFAWFCPEEKGLLDDRLTTAILTGTPALHSSPGSEAKGEGVAYAWDEQMRSAGINHVIVYEPHRGRLLAALDRLLAEPEQWPLLFQEGDLAVFGWRDPAKAGATDAFRGWELDLNRLAFHPAKDKRAPQQAPEWGPEQRPWWDAFWRPAPPRPIDRDEATLHLLHAEAVRRSAPLRHQATWEATQSAAVVAAAGSWTGPAGLVDAHLRLVLVRPPLPEVDSADTPSALAQLTLAWQTRYAWQQDDTPPALLYLAVRAARRAVAKNPLDAEAYLVLGQSYLRLLHNTRERDWSERMPDLIRLRRVQASTALNQAVSLKPDLAQAHFHLGEMYRQMGYLDLALGHLRTHWSLLQKAGPRPGMSAEQFDEQQAASEETLSLLARTVEVREAAYATESARFRVYDRAMLALKKGLAGKALAVLEDTDYANFGPEGMGLEIELLLRTGRAKDVLEWIGPDQKAALGPAAYYTPRVQALAASGEYLRAQEECALAAGEQVPPARAREVMALLIGQAVLQANPEGGSVPSLLWQIFPMLQFRSRIANLARTLTQQADVSVLQGLIALEEGEVDEAKVYFQAALQLWKHEAAAASGTGLDFNGRVVAQGCLEWLK
jgi:hypothetical protein